MKRWSQSAVLLVVIPVLAEAQTGFVQNSIFRPYEAKPVAPASFQNSERIFDLIRAGHHVSFIGGCDRAGAGGTTWTSRWSDISRESRRPTSGAQQAAEYFAD